MKDINDILAAYFSGEISLEDKRYVEEWKVENEEEFLLLSEAWNETIDFDGINLEFKEFDTKKALEKVNAQLEEHSKTKIIKLRFYKKVAAACAILFIGLAGFWFLKNSIGSETLVNKDLTPREVQLPDGSKVWLASNAQINYPSNFTSNRSVTLKGEGFFEVAKNKDYPFVITTEVGEVEVLGTAFNVNTTSDKTVVSVEHGKVALRNSNAEVKLTAGESASATKTEISAVETVDENFLSWKTGNFVFESTPLDEAIFLLNKFYTRKIILTNTNNIPLFNGKFNNEKLENIIEAIVLTCNVKAEYGEKEIRLK